jgi:hypothetical protein
MTETKKPNEQPKPRTETPAVPMREVPTPRRERQDSHEPTQIDPGTGSTGPRVKKPDDT